MFGFGRLKRMSDEQLLSEFARGKHRAFEELVTRYSTPIEHFARRLLQNPQTAEEITADTFERLAREQGRVSLLTSFRAYLFAIARNRCIDKLRRRRREQEAHPHIVQLESHRRPPPHPEAIARLGELAATLESAVASLPETHREVVLLRLVHGLSSQETAQILACTEEQVRSLLSYARKQIRKSLNEQPEALPSPRPPRLEKGVWRLMKHEERQKAVLLNDDEALDQALAALEGTQAPRRNPRAVARAALMAAGLLGVSSALPAWEGVVKGLNLYFSSFPRMRESSICKCLPDGFPRARE